MAFSLQPCVLAALIHFLRVKCACLALKAQSVLEAMTRHGQRQISGKRFRVSGSRLGSLNLPFLSRIQTLLSSPSSRALSVECADLITAVLVTRQGGCAHRASLARMGKRCVDPIVVSRVNFAAQK